jgi:hypothetical protein
MKPIHNAKVTYYAWRRTRYIKSLFKQLAKTKVQATLEVPAEHGENHDA